MAIANQHAPRDRHPADGEVRSWPERTLRWDGLGEGPLDLRYLLDAPAGRHGAIRVRAGRLEAADGTLAERLGRAGCTLVRVHHADSPHGPAYFDYGRPGPDGLPLAADAMARFDRLFAELKLRGVATVDRIHLRMLSGVI